ncbi:tetratricopeptide repeat protein, partial [Haemophilus parainfluenzae]|uniref:tetratricopeptide repeat protein n=1 Tax=Haemophilus parainfluenzae TaxID=729 RepID=UPI00124B37E4
PSVAESLGNLANLYQIQGRYGKAESAYKEALRIVQKQLGERHPRVAQILNNLASLYLDEGRYRETESLLNQALAIRRQQLGNNHPS